jgi:hypothetical protein
MCRQTIESVFDKFWPVLLDPHLFLACAAKTETISAVNAGGSASVYHVATHEALANAALFQVVMEEVSQAYRPQLAEGEHMRQFLQGPLEMYSRDASIQKQLVDFMKGKNTSLRPGYTEQGYTNPARAKFQPAQGGTYESVRNTTRPQPLTAFPALAELAYKAMAQPRTQNRAKGVFSIASGEFRAGKRNTKAHMWSAIVRKKNIDNLRMRDTTRKREFISMFSKCLAFGRNNKSEIKAIYTPDLAESEQKFEARMKKDMPQFAQAGGSLEKTNICDAAESRNVLRAPDRNGGSEQNKRYRGVAYDQGRDSLES